MLRFFALTPIDYTRFKMLLAGRFPISMREIVQSKSDVPLISACNYYQGGGDAGERQILIRKGSDLKKRKRSLKRILEGEVNPLAAEEKKLVLVDESGTPLTTLEVQVDQSTSAYFLHCMPGLLDQISTFIEKSSLVQAFSAESKRYYPGALSILNKLIKQKEAVFYFYEVYGQDKSLIFRNCERALFCALLGMAFELDEKTTQGLA